MRASSPGSSRPPAYAPALEPKSTARGIDAIVAIALHRGDPREVDATAADAAAQDVDAGPGGARAADVAARSAARAARAVPRANIARDPTSRGGETRGARGPERVRSAAGCRRAPRPGDECVRPQTRER